MNASFKSLCGFDFLLGFGVHDLKNYNHQLCYSNSTNLTKHYLVFPCLLKFIVLSSNQ